MPGVFRIHGGEVTFPSGSIVDADISTTTDISVDKLQHLHHKGTNFNLAIGGTPATREEIIFVAGAAGVLRGFHAILNDTGTNTNIDFDLKVNGSSVLSAAVNFTHADGDGAVKDGTITGTTISVDDIISISMAVTLSTGAQGPYAWVNITENEAPS